MPPQRRKLSTLAVSCGLLAFAGVFLINLLSISSSIPGHAEPNLAHLTSLLNTSSRTKQQLRSALEAYDSARRHGVKKQEPGVQQGPVEMRDFPMNVYFTGKGKQREVEVEFCRLDYGAYQKNPEMHPMFTDLERAFCPDKYGEARRRVKLSELTKERDKVRSLEPSGFIFHESRVGSTLLANLLASSAPNLVYSEPHLPFLALRQCRGCSEEQLIELLRDVVWVMGRSATHQHLFIKFQSALVPYMHTILKAFPNTPWLFLFREPVEVMVSNFRKGPAGPCVRSKKQPPPEVLAVLDTDAASVAQVPDVTYCAAHLESICREAIRLLELYPGKGVAVDYQGLPQKFIETLVPGHFGVALSEAELEVMQHKSGVYSKSRQGAVDFMGDSEAKQETASVEVAEAAKLLTSSFAQLQDLSKRPLDHIHRNAELRKQESLVYSRTGSKFFDLPSCPDDPAMPPEHPIVDLLANWNPDDVSVPPRHYSTLCRLDYQKDHAKAMRYRDAEVPFVLYNIPELEATSHKWSDPAYLPAKLGDKKYHVEVSKNNHFMYYRAPSKKKVAKDFVPPTESARWTYQHWLDKATSVQNISAEAEHYYFRVSDPDAAFLLDDLSIFQPVPGLFLKEPQEQRGIHCRFGMKGVIAEAHFDSSRNMVALLYGTRRWILAHPRECHNCYLLPPNHPSGRHSEVDWSRPDLKQYPVFKHMMGHEVLLTPGDVLYVPAYWIHYIVNLDTNCQCNTRSGDSLAGLQDVIDCGFKGLKSLQSELLAKEKEPAATTQ